MLLWMLICWALWTVDSGRDTRDKKSRIGEKNQNFGYMQKRKMVFKPNEKRAGCDGDWMLDLEWIRCEKAQTIIIIIKLVTYLCGHSLQLFACVRCSGLYAKIANKNGKWPSFG